MDQHDDVVIASSDYVSGWITEAELRINPNKKEDVTLHIGFDGGLFEQMKISRYNHDYPNNTKWETIPDVFSVDLRLRGVMARYGVRELGIVLLDIATAMMTYNSGDG